jgi:Icc-related predicted phosphoesterase
LIADRDVFHAILLPRSPPPAKLRGLALAESSFVQMRIAALGDLHFPHGRPGELAKRLEGIEQHADVLLLCGDLTETGDPHQARALAELLARLELPVVGVLGNHDHESGQTDLLRVIFGDAGVLLLDGDATVVGALGIAGVKGFGGGFGRRRVAAFGEESTKLWVEAGQREARKLEEALRALDCGCRVVVMHYSPVVGTLQGEAPEIIPFLGNSELALAAERGGAEAMFHGHSHFGRPEARTDGGIPVYNCAAPMLDQLRPPRRFVVVQLDVPG